MNYERYEHYEYYEHYEHCCCLAVKFIGSRPGVWISLWQTGLISAICPSVESFFVIAGPIGIKGKIYTPEFNTLLCVWQTGLISTIWPSVESFFVIAGPPWQIGLIMPSGKSGSVWAQGAINRENKRSKTEAETDGAVHTKQASRMMFPPSYIGIKGKIYTPGFNTLLCVTWWTSCRLTPALSWEAAKVLP